ncbi:MAG: hypothetical protein ACJ789_09810 [Thermomicrobiales bacterium]
MARIFAGNRAMVDEELLEAVKQLNDDFWVFAEFDVHRRNIDWLIIRQVPDDRPAGRFSTVILTELKRTRAILDGDDNGRWRECREGIWAELEPGNMRDANPWRQLINTVNVFRDWMYNNQRRFLTDGDGQLYPESAVKVWPNLLILSDPPDLVHRLPLKPQNGYGAYHFELDEWIRRVYGWTPRDGLRLTASELADLAHALSLTPIVYEPNATRRFTEPFAVDLEPADMPALSGSLDWVDGLSVWAAGIEQRVRHLEQQLAALSESAVPRSPERKPARTLAPVATNPDRPLSEHECELIVNAMTALRAAGKNRDFPSVFAEMHRVIGGPTFKSRNFNGYGSAMAMMLRAATEGLVRFGPLDGNGVPTLFLPDEAIDEALVIEAEMAEAGGD